MWDNLHEIFQPHPLRFFKIISTLSNYSQFQRVVFHSRSVVVYFVQKDEESGMKMLKAINLIRDEIVMIKEMMLTRDGEKD